MDGIVIPISAETHFQLWAEHTVKPDSYLNSAGFMLPPTLYEAEAAHQLFMALLFPGHLLFNFFPSQIIFVTSSEFDLRSNFA